VSGCSQNSTKPKVQQEHQSLTCSIPHPLGQLQGDKLLMAGPESLRPGHVALEGKSLQWSLTGNLVNAGCFVVLS
jgi:hypothetical protein